MSARDQLDRDLEAYIRAADSHFSGLQAEAAAKAAALRAKLKFHDVEIEQKAQLTKTRLLRDLEVEEAKYLGCVPTRGWRWEESTIEAGGMRRCLNNVGGVREGG